MPAANEQPQYDSRGNQTRDSLFDYEWDAADRLVRVQTRSDVVGMPASERVRATYAYDYLGRRIGKQVHSWNGSSWQVESTRKFIWDEKQKGAKSKESPVRHQGMDPRLREDDG